VNACQEAGEVTSLGPWGSLESRTATLPRRLAASKAAEALHDEGFEGRILLIGTETERPYERPPLSKDYLLGKAEQDSIYVHPLPWYDEHDVEPRLGTTVTGIDRAVPRGRPG
jgi:3-phenylpropionate/trans-cinnamate dioxygenase ferredoxin reductase component